MGTCRPHHRPGRAFCRQLRTFARKRCPSGKCTSHGPAVPRPNPPPHLLLRRTVFSSGALGCGGNPRPVGSIAGTPVKFIRRTVLFRRVEVQQRHLITSVKGVNHGLVSRNHRSQAKRGFFNAE